MPRCNPLIQPTPEEQIKKNSEEVRDYLASIMRARKITMERVGKEIGKTKSDVSYQLKNRISIELVIAIIKLASLDEDELNKLRRLMLK